MTIFSLWEVRTKSWMSELAEPAENVQANGRHSPKRPSQICWQTFATQLMPRTWVISTSACKHLSGVPCSSFSSGAGDDTGMWPILQCFHRNMTSFLFSLMWSTCLPCMLECKRNLISAFLHLLIGRRIHYAHGRLRFDSHGCIKTMTKQNSRKDQG